MLPCGFPWQQPEPDSALHTRWQLWRENKGQNPQGNWAGLGRCVRDRTWGALISTRFLTHHKVRPCAHPCAPWDGVTAEENWSPAGVWGVCLAFLHSWIHSTYWSRPTRYLTMLSTPGTNLGKGRQSRPQAVLPATCT
jgi:hypothetical protein